MLENVEIVAVMLDTNGNVTFCNDYLLGLTRRARGEVLRHREAIMEKLGIHDRAELRNRYSDSWRAHSACLRWVMSPQDPGEQRPGLAGYVHA